MAKNFIQPGDIVGLTAPAATISGALVTVGRLVGVAQHDAASGSPVQIALSGVFEVTKASGQAWTEGAAIYATAAGVATTAASGNILIGAVIEAAASAATLGKIRLNGVATAA